MLNSKKCNVCFVAGQHNTIVCPHSPSSPGSRENKIVFPFFWKKLCLQFLISSHPWRIIARHLWAWVYFVNPVQVPQAACEDPRPRTSRIFRLVPVTHVRWLWQLIIIQKRLETFNGDSLSSQSPVWNQVRLRETQMINPNNLQWEFSSPTYWPAEICLRRGGGQKGPFGVSVAKTPGTNEKRKFKKKNKKWSKACKSRIMFCRKQKQLMNPEKWLMRIEDEKGSKTKTENE